MKNITKVKAGDRLIKDLQQGRDLKGKYLYVKDEKILTIVRLFLHNNIMRIDRLVYKAVPDFIDFHIGNFHWFVFNPADIFITFGVICLILDEFIFKSYKYD